jgi:hypothetical protein
MTESHISLFVVRKNVAVDRSRLVGSCRTKHEGGATSPP